MTFSLKRQFSAKVSLTGTFPHLKYGGTIGCSPRVQEIVFAGGDKPLSRVCKLEGEDAGVVEVELILLLVVDVKHFHIAALHPAMDTYLSEPAHTGVLCLRKSFGEQIEPT